MPGIYTLAACLLELTDSLYAQLVNTTPDGPEKDGLIAEWTVFRDKWKPRLDRLLIKKR